MALSGVLTEPHERLRALIDERWDGTDRELAEAADIHPVTLSRLVTGQTRLGASASIERVLALLGATMADVFGVPGGVVRETTPPYPDPELVDVDLEGHPVMNDVEAILSWLPDDMSTRWTGRVGILDRLAEVYAYGSRAGWSADRLDFVHKVRSAVQAIQRREDRPPS